MKKCENKTRMNGTIQNTSTETESYYCFKDILSNFLALKLFLLLPLSH